MQTKHSAGSVPVKGAFVDRELVETVWPKVKHFIDPAVRVGDWSFEAIEKEVLDGSAIMLVALDGEKFIAVAVIQIWETHRGRLCVILASGGKQLHRWKDFMALVEDYARKQGCSCVRLYGRKGWKRIFPDFAEPWITLEKRL